LYRGLERRGGVTNYDDKRNIIDQRKAWQRTWSRKTPGGVPSFPPKKAIPWERPEGGDYAILPWVTTETKSLRSRLSRERGLSKRNQRGGTVKRG